MRAPWCFLDAVLLQQGFYFFFMKTNMTSIWKIRKISSNEMLMLGKIFENI